MTKNQIDYFAVKVQQAHNIASEQETNRSNLAKEELERSSQAIQEQHYLRSDAETNRSNLANEAIKREQNAISRETNKVRREELAETGRHNLATEGFTEYLLEPNRAKLESDVELNASKSQEAEGKASYYEMSAFNKPIEARKTAAEAEFTEKRVKWYDKEQAVNLWRGLVGAARDTVSLGTYLGKTLTNLLE